METEPTLLSLVPMIIVSITIATLPDALTLGSIPELTNPFTPLKGSLDQVQTAATGLQETMTGLKTLLGA